MSENRGVDNLLAFLLGAAVGAGVALLLAPQSGEETRKLIGDRAKRLGDDVDHRLQGVKDTVRTQADDFKQALAAGKEAYQKTRRSADEVAPTSSTM
jgi:gas vesicle protein